MEKLNHDEQFISEKVGFLPSLRFKILLLFIVILVIPLVLLMQVSIKRTEEAAQNDFTRRLTYSGGLLRSSMEDKIEWLRIRAKTVADFDFYSQAKTGFSASMTTQLMQSELIRSGLDFVGLIQNGVTLLQGEGTLPTAQTPKIIPSICHLPLAANLYVLDQEPWIFAAAEITKLRGIGKYHILLAYRFPRDFADSFKRLTEAEFTVIYSGKRVLTTLMDQMNHRMIDTPLPQSELRNGTLEINGKKFNFVREEAIPGKISEPIFIEIALPISEFQELGAKIAGDFTLFGIFGIFLAIITGTILAWHIGLPLNELAQSTTQLASGDFSLTVKTNRRDEIGQLFRNFGAMVSGLKLEKELKENKMRELSTLFEISNAVNFLSDSVELLKFVLTRAIDIFSAERGSIMLLDDVTDELVIKVVFGGRYRVSSSTPIKLGHGICGLVAKEGKGRICNAGFRDTEFKNFGSLIPVEDIKTLLVSPLKFKDGTIGVINIVNKRDGEEFTEGDLALLNLIASQAAITIENNKLYELSITDGLTRLFVQRYFLARLAEELLRARRYGLKLSLIMIDIDNFKQFNDVYGHQTGDLVLQRVAMAIRDTVRIGIDIPCRYGGEEMVVILPETRSEEAHKTAERLRETIASLSISHPMGNLKITCSLGVASYPMDAIDKDTLLLSADKAMYFSKRAGKNCTTIASEMDKI
ncbi:MAG: diguanylate cyclase [Candidatus Riflebacteria bacterium]|nr:diguanylate cyclase [Candidatus Riflebacteria bacterium]